MRVHTLIVLLVVIAVIALPAAAQGQGRHRGSSPGMRSHSGGSSWGGPSGRTRTTGHTGFVGTARRGSDPCATSMTRRRIGTGCAPTARRRVAPIETHFTSRARVGRFDNPGPSCGTERRRVAPACDFRRTGTRMRVSRMPDIDFTGRGRGREDGGEGCRTPKPQPVFRPAPVCRTPRPVCRRDPVRADGDPGYFAPAGQGGRHARSDDGGGDNDW